MFVIAVILPLRSPLRPRPGKIISASAVIVITEFYCTLLLKEQKKAFLQIRFAFELEIV